MYVIEYTTERLGKLRLRAMAYGGIPYSTDKITKEILFESESDANLVCERMKRLAGFEGSPIRVP